MSDIVILAWITLFSAIVSTVGLIVIAFINRKVSIVTKEVVVVKENIVAVKDDQLAQGVKVDEYHKQVNGRMGELLDTTKALGKAEEKAEHTINGNIKHLEKAVAKKAKPKKKKK